VATSSGGPRLCIALLIDHLESPYAAELVAGVLRATRLARVRTLIVPGGWLAPPGSDPAVRNFVYELLAETRVDGILISAGSLSNHSGLEHFRSWLHRFRHLPSGAIGLDVVTVPSVHVDNEPGMYDAITQSPGSLRGLELWAQASSDGGGPCPVSGEVGPRLYSSPSKRSSSSRSILGARRWASRHWLGARRKPPITNSCARCWAPQPSPAGHES
jgi:hypothetical protein